VWLCISVPAAVCVLVASASTQGQSLKDAEYLRDHARARSGCSHARKDPNVVLPSGGYCYGTRESGWVWMRLPGNHSYWLPRHHVPADTRVVDTLLTIVRPRSVLDLGAGVGQLGHALQSKATSIDYRGLDGGGDVESTTAGFVRWFDLRKPLALRRAEWVVSLEVGEHIAVQHELAFVRNIHAHNCRGVILSWASPGQKGHLHVNTHTEAYMTQVFSQLGYVRNVSLESALRGSSETRVVKGPLDARVRVKRQGWRARLEYIWLNKTLVFQRSEAVC